MTVSLSLGMRRLLIAFGLLGLFALAFDWITGAQYIEFMGNALRAALGMGG